MMNGGSQITAYFMYYRLPRVLSITYMYSTLCHKSGSGKGTTLVVPSVANKHAGFSP